MFLAVGGIYAGLIQKYERKWTEEKEALDWKRWEECEIMRRKMGHVTNIEKIPRSSRRSRKKHRH